MGCPARFLVFAAGFLAVGLGCGGEASSDTPPPEDAIDASEIVATEDLFGVDVGLDGDPEDEGPLPDAPLGTPDVAPDVDPTPVAHCSGPGDLGLSEEAQVQCVTCLDLPPAGSVAAPTPPTTPPFERVPELEARLNVPEFRYGDFKMVTSILAQDLDADGVDDLIVTGRVGGEGLAGSPASRALFVTPAGDVGPAAPLPISDPSLVVLTAADLDGDGRRDLLAVSTAGMAILWNTPLGFIESDALVTWLEPPAGLPENVPLPELVYTYTVMDLEGDGDTDVLVALFGGPNQVWRNDGNRAFTDITEALGLVDSGHLTFFMAPFAWDPAAGLRGIFIANDGLSGVNHSLSLVPGSSGELWTQALTPIPPLCDSVRMAMCDAVVGKPCGGDIFANMQAMAGQASAGGMALGTFSGAGTTSPMGVGCFHHRGARPMCVFGQTDFPAPDYVVTHVGEGSWGLLSGALDLLKPRTTGGHVAVSWAVLPLDDGDGLEDLLITTGDNEEFHSAGSSPMAIMMLQNFLGETLEDTRGESRVAFYVAQPDGRFDERGAAWGFDGLGHFATAAPVWLPVGGVPTYHVIVGGFGQAFQVYRLAHPRGRLVRLNLRGTVDNPDGIGARVTVTDGDATWTRIVGWESTQIRSGNLHQATTVGVGSALAVDVEIRWPNGTEEVYLGLAADGAQRVLVQGEGANSEGSQ